MYNKFTEEYISHYIHLYIVSIKFILKFFYK